MERTPDLVVIGSSTGGPKALLDIFSHVQANLPFPVIIVNHFPKGDFTKVFCREFNTKTGLDIHEGTNKEKLQAGSIVMCPGGHHLSLQKTPLGMRILIDDEPAIDGCKPSIDKFFESVIDLKLPYVLGMVLTGMGHDGAKGALELTKNNYPVYTQDKASCTIYGMPLEVEKIGASKGSLSPKELASKILSSPKVRTQQLIAEPKSNSRATDAPNKPVTIGLRDDDKTSKTSPIQTKEDSSQLSSKDPHFELTKNRDIKQKDLKDVQLTQPELEIMKGFIEKETAMNIYSKDKEYLLKERIPTLILANGHKSFISYFNDLKSTKSMLNELVDSMTINESFFFRDHYPFRFLKDQWVKEVGSTRQSFNIWSTACANGQEVYSIIFSLQEALDQNPGLSWKNFRVYASDISPHCVNFSKNGVYSSNMTRRGLRHDQLDRFFQPHGQSKQVLDELRKLIRWYIINLSESYHQVPMMDVIYCRYVLIYFDEVNQAKVLTELAKKLKPGGYLILDPAMSLRVNLPDLNMVQFERFKIFQKNA